MRGALAVLFLISACGGSSSETPPPLEPDPRNLYRGTGAPPVQKEKPVTPAPEIEEEEDLSEPAPSKNGTRAPQSTWGEKPAPSELK